MSEVLTYNQWKQQYGSTLQDDEWQTVDEKIDMFNEIHGLDLSAEVERMQQQEYQLYIQRIAAGLTE